MTFETEKNSGCRSLHDLDEQNVFGLTGVKKPDAYRASGVDQEGAGALIRAAAPLIRRTYGETVLSPEGYFCALVALPSSSDVLALSCDGVGTKLLLAEKAGEYEGIGVDCVAMVVNDLITCGARPLAFLDYYAAEALEPPRARALLRGIARACLQSACALVGGETAQLPGLYPRGAFDLAGFGVALASRRRLEALRRQQAGDRLYALPSSGFHANGFSLLRRLVKRRGLDLQKPLPGCGPRALRQLLLTPTRIYAKPLLALFNAGLVRSAAHITGGGLEENLPRALGEGLRAVVTLPGKAPRPFEFFRELAGLSLAEAYRVWNMGVGMVAVVPAQKEAAFVARCRALKIKAFPLGHLEKGARGVDIEFARD